MTISNPVYQEEISAYGYAKIGHMAEESLEWFRKDIINRKVAQVDRYGSDWLADQKILNVVTPLVEEHSPQYLNFVNSGWVSEVADTVLHGSEEDGKPSLQKSVGVLHTKSGDSRSVFGFHRAMSARDGEIWSVDFYVALTDHTKENGATEVVRGSHLGEDGWSTAFLEKNRTPLIAKAGDVFVLDSSLFRRPGINTTDDIRIGMSFQFQR